jgi:GNAT superfamily N-acetyltransferase
MKSNKNWKIIFLKDRPDLNPKAVSWFHEKWNVPEEAYLESIIECQKNKDGIPQWYLVLDEEDKIIAGVGVIENDFHKRKDLKPNVCALFVEEEYRGMGIAKTLLDLASRDANNRGYKDVYLITGHTQFYEKCGWSFYGMVEEDNGHLIRMYQKL